MKRANQSKMRATTVAKAARGTSVCRSAAKRLRAASAYVLQSKRPFSSSLLFPSKDEADDFDKVLDRRAPSVGSAKWRRYDEDVIPLWVADMDFQAPPSVRSALSNFAENQVYGYSRIPPELVTPRWDI